MATELYFSTGQAAKEWGVSVATVRALCAAGAIDHQTTPGGQYRIPKSAVAKYTRDGLPAVPRPLPDHTPQPTRSRHGHPALLADPSDDVVSAAEGLVITENRLKRRKLERELEETEDWFRDRDEREAQRLAEREAAEREQRARAAAERDRREWTQRWTDHAFGLIPGDAPREVRLDVADAVRHALDSGDPYQPDPLTDRLVEAAVERALVPWRRNKERQKAIADACENYRLPFDLRYREPWKHRVRHAATAAVEALPDTATEGRLKAEAAAAIAPLLREYEHQKRCNEAIEGVWRLLPGGTSDEWEEGKEALQEALPALPIGASQRQFDAACQTALEPIRAAIAERQDREMREDVIRSAKIRLPWGLSSEATEEALTEIREALDELPEGTPRLELDTAANRIIEQYKADYQREKNKQQLIEAGLRGIYSYLLKLEKDYEFDKGAWSLEQEITPAIREALAEDLEGDESPQELARLVRELVREQLRL